MVVLTLGELRSLIREQLDQAFAGVQEPGEEPPEHEEWGGKPAAAHKRPVQRFFNRKFVDSAIKLYGNLSIPVYVVPVWSHNPSNLFTDNPRAVSGDVGTLVKFGVSPERAEELQKACDAGAAVFVAKVARLEKGNLPTPWMIVHAMFDSSTAHEMFSDLISAVYRAGGKDHAFADMFESEHERTILGALTMASARNGQIQAYSDAMSEILTQAILTKRGFVYNETGVPAVDSFLADVARAVEPARAEFEKIVSGKITVVEVHLLNG